MNTLTLSPTGIQTYLSCPKKYFLSRSGLPRTATVAMIIGSAFHKAAEVLVGALMSRKRPTDVLAEAEITLVETLELERALGSIDPADAGLESAEETALGLLRAVAPALPEDWEPVAVEQAVEMPIADGVALRGFTDLILRDSTIVDFKTTKRRTPENETRHNLQFTAYAVLRNHVDGVKDSPRKVTVVEVTKTKTAAVYLHDTVRNKEDFTAYRELVTGVASAIQQGIDYPSPSAWCRFCQYKAHCTFGCVGADEKEAA